ncbi:MAG TPA: TonB-dependent receptor [Terriglobales bacterium]|nr:TonB-dependent receptor [Terriglobales bacterium]
MSRRLPMTLLALALTASVALAQTAGQEKAEQKKEKPKEKPKTEEKAGAKEETKFFQLDMITIDVVEKARDAEVPNMTVVKTELFPLTIGTSLDTALERLPGVDVQRVQEIGTAIDDDSIKIRGMSSRRIKVLKNGRLLNAPGAAGGYFIDWTMIPLSNVDRVEVIKGVGDARYGNVLGGVINLVPKRLPSERPLTELQLSGGSYDTGTVNVYHAYKPGAFEYSLALGGDVSHGYLENGRSRFGSGELHLGYDFSFKGRLTADLTYAAIRKGFIVPNRLSKDPDSPDYAVPSDPAFPASDGEYMYGGMGATPEPGSWWKKHKLMVETGYEQAVGRTGVLDAWFWKNIGNRESYNTRAALDRVFHKLFYEDRSYGFGGSYRQKLGPNVLEAGVDYGFLHDAGERVEADDFRGPSSRGYYTGVRNLEGYVQADLALGGERWVLSPGARYMSWQGVAGPSGVEEGIPNVRMNGLAPSVKLTFAYAADSAAYLSLARAVRMPAVPEYFWHYDVDAGVDTRAIPFRPEDGVMVQAGWRTVLPSRTRVEVAPYYYRILHYIQFDLINFISYNIGRGTIAGLELEAAQQLGRGWSAFANYTFEKSRTAGDQFKALFIDPVDQGFDEIPGLPRSKANVGLRYRTRSDLSVAAFVQYVSSQKVIYNDNQLYNTDLRVRTQGSYVRLDVEARWPVARGFEVDVFGRNLTNVHYQERYGFPAAGRTAGISVKTQF